MKKDKTKETITIRFWGKYGCFSQFKVERFSFPLPTPSAARGMLEAIYYKPGVVYRIKSIAIMSPVEYVRMKRNEIKTYLPRRVPDHPISIDTTQQQIHTQRQTIMVHQPDYEITFQVFSADGDPAKTISIIDQIKRRARHGQQFHQPYFGCKEFLAHFTLIEEDSQRRLPAQINMNIGMMTYDTYDLSNLGTETGEPSISVFRAQVENGIMIVPDYESEMVHKIPKHIA